MAEQLVTKKCPECRTIFRDRGQRDCPHCGYRFGLTSAPASSAESRAVPAPPPPPPPPPPPSPPPAPAVPPAPVSFTTSSELDAVRMPYSDQSSRRLGDFPPPAPSHAGPHRDEPMPEFERAPRPPALHRDPAHVPDPIQAVLGDKPLVPADVHGDPEALMPWYLKRRTLVGLALLAVLLIALVVQWS